MYSYTFQLNQKFHTVLHKGFLNLFVPFTPLVTSQNGIYPTYLVLYIYMCKSRVCKLPWVTKFTILG